MTTKTPSLVDARDILNHAVRLAHLVEMAAESLDPERYDAISMGTNAIIGEIREADEIIDRHLRKARADNPQPEAVECTAAYSKSP